MQCTRRLERSPEMGRMKDVLIYVENDDFFGLVRDYGLKTALWAFLPTRPKKRRKAIERKGLSVRAGR